MANPLCGHYLLRVSFLANDTSLGDAMQDNSANLIIPKQKEADIGARIEAVLGEDHIPTHRRDKLDLLAHEICVAWVEVVADAAKAFSLRVEVGKKLSAARKLHKTNRDYGCWVDEQQFAFAKRE